MKSKMMRASKRSGSWRSGPRTSNAAESAFAATEGSKGSIVLKRGWPDFAIVRGEVFEVCEVKPGIFRDGDSRERLKYEQTWLMFLLKVAGIPCFVSDGRRKVPFDAKEHGCVEWLVDNKLVDSHEAVALRLRRMFPAL